MIPKVKAKQLYELIRYDVSTLKGTDALINEVTKRCAIMAVDEILYLTNNANALIFLNDYYLKVKQEIEKI